MIRNLRQRKAFRILLYVVAFIFIYCEFLSYFLMTVNWTDITCPPESKCTRLLFVADPQILGDRGDPLWITRWDSDRYLQRTYSMALWHAKPDGVVFLGDLMDEGSIANDWEFSEYVDRFFSIFPRASNIKTFYIPGDNDIGGEDGEPIFPNVVNRFRRTFNKSIDILIGTCHILKVNPAIEVMPRVDPAHVASDPNVRIAVSHFPLVGFTSQFSDKMVQQFQPHVVFSAHSHSSRMKHGVMTSNSPLTSLLPISIRRGDPSRATGDEEGWTSSRNILEISVPTCSYRMGVYLMGYGFAVIDSTRRELWYVVLWLPSRLHQLRLYTVLIAFVIIVRLAWFCLTSVKSSYTQVH